MNRKAFLAAFVALLMPWKKTPAPITVALTLDDSKFREMLREATANARRIAESRGAEFHEINDPERPEIIGFSYQEVES